MNWFKRCFSLVLCALMIFSLAACGGGNDSKYPEGTTVLKFFHRFPDEPYNSFIEDKLAEYEKNNPGIKFEVTSAQNDPYKEKIKVTIGTDDAPDIFFSWAGEFTERFIREDLVMDLTPYLEKDTEWKDSLMASQVAEYTTDDGMVYGIPFRLNAKMFFYNKDLFTKHNVAVPATWDEFISACKTFDSAGVTPLAYGNKAQWPSSHYIGTLNQMLVNKETRYQDYNPAKAEFTDPGYLEALKRYEELIPYFSKGANGMEHDMSRGTFAQGSAAMIYVELVEIPYLEADNPDLNYGMFKFPTVEGEGDTETLTGAPEGFCISSKTKHAEESIAFLKWFLGPEVGAEQATEIGWFNASLGIDKEVESETLVEAYNVISGAEAMEPWFDNAIYSTICDEYLTTVSDLTNGDITPEEVMKKIQKVAKEAQSLVGD